MIVEGRSRYVVNCVNESGMSVCGCQLASSGIKSIACLQPTIAISITENDPSLAVVVE